MIAEDRMISASISHEIANIQDENEKYVGDGNPPVATRDERMTAVAGTKAGSSPHGDVQLYPLSP